MFDFTKKVDPSGSPVGADRSEIKCYIGRCAVRPFLVPRGPKICQKRYQHLNLAQNPGGCRPENPSLYPPLRGAPIGTVSALLDLAELINFRASGSAKAVMAKSYEAGC